MTTESAGANQNDKSVNEIEIPQEAFDWYDEYAHGDIDRRTFLTRLASLSVAGLTVSAIGGALIPDYAKAEQVSFNDPTIKATYEGFASPDGHGEGGGYLVQPTTLPASGVAPCVLVVHENRGLNPSQIKGGMVWGAGYALTGGIHHHEDSASFVNPDFGEYHIAVNRDIAEVNLDFLEEPDYAASPVGAKGIGELGITGAGAAIANAIFDATKVRVRDFPITMDKIIGG